MQRFIVLGLGFGDEGKGATVDHIASSLYSSLAVRFNGGAQCVHNVVAGGKHHEFNQFGSNSLCEKTSTLFTHYAYFNPLVYFLEQKRLLDIGVERPFYLSHKTEITTPWHMALNRLKEVARGDGRHGSTGMGIGETATCGDNLIAEDLFTTTGYIFCEDLQTHFSKEAKKLLETIPEAIKTASAFEIEKIKELLSFNARDYWNRLKNLQTKNFKVVNDEEEKQLLQDNNLIFEGAQGVLLDQDYGFHPHTTWSKTTDENVWTLLSQHGLTFCPRVVGVLRSHHTRHGQGPFPSEIKDGCVLSELHNKTHYYAGAFRFGYFDAILARYAIEVNRGVDELAWTHLDWVGKAKDKKGPSAVSTVVESYVFANQYALQNLHVPKFRNLAAAIETADTLSKVVSVEFATIADLPSYYKSKGYPTFSEAHGPDRKDRVFKR